MAKTMCMRRNWLGSAKKHGNERWGVCSGESEFLISKNHHQDEANKSRKYVIVLTLISALGGFLFGYDTGVISGAMIPIRETFQLNPIMVELIVSVTIAAAAISAFAAGFLCDRIGRRATLIIASVVFTIGAVVLGASYFAWMLMIGRIIVGIGIGIAAMASPMYIAESAPANMRGKLVVVNVLFITGGQFVATILDGIFSYLPYNIGWRFMLALAGIPSIIMFFGLLFLPETPRWLVFHGKSKEAQEALEKLHHPSTRWTEYQNILRDCDVYTKTQTGWLDLVRRFCSSRSVLLALMVGCGLQLFQQFGGINTVMYYSASIIQMAGFSDRNAIWLATIPGGANFLFTIVGLLLVDRLGRRKLLIVSVCGIIFSFILLSTTFFLMDRFSPPAQMLNSSLQSCDYHHCGSCVGNSNCGFCVDMDLVTGELFNGTCNPIQRFNNGSTFSKFVVSDGRCAVAGENYLHVSSDALLDKEEFLSRMSPQNLLDRQWLFHSCPHNNLAPLTIMALFVYIAFFAPGMGPIPWTVNSEIYPTWARSTAISIATMVNWISNLVVSMTFLTMTDALGQPYTFGLYAGLSVLGLIFIILFVPETKGRSLEDVDALFQRPYYTSWCNNTRP